MIDFERITLANGLKVIVHTDTSTPLVALNILYHVGARDEDPDRTGFAHLFEHLMFGGSKNINSYDYHVEKIGGENNAFTNNDITNYYLSVPAENIETALWLESDRMLDLAFSEKNLDVQKNVVMEEYRQRYLNQPYGDIWLLLRPLAYKVHPYRWPTIGMDISHIANATMHYVRIFYKTYYNPSNAIMTFSGNIQPDKAFRLAEKWFGEIPNKGMYTREIPQEPEQKEERQMVVHRKVPLNAIVKAWHMPGRQDPGYYATDLLSDILSNGNSSRLQRNLVKDNAIFSEINAYITGDIDPGLFIVSGKPREGISIDYAKEAIDVEINKIVNEKVKPAELEKVLNKLEATTLFSEISILDKAMNLSYYELLGDARLYNEAMENYKALDAEDLRHHAGSILNDDNSSTLLYLASSGGDEATTTN